MNNNFHDDLHSRLGKFNIKQYQYLFFDRSSVIAPEICSTYPKAWLKFYQKEKLYHTDPILNLARTTVKPFAWSSIIPFLSSEDQIFFKRAKQFGINDGYTFAVNDALGNSAFLNVMCDDELHIDILFFNSHRAELQMLLVDLYDLYLRQKKYIEYYRNKAHLIISEKEKQVLSLGCDGLKYKEIATKLGISERTVKFHMSKIVDKLEVGNAKQAFLRVKELNII